MTIGRLGRWWMRLVAVVTLVVVTSVVGMPGSIESVAASDDIFHVNPDVNVYFPETGQVSRGPFLAYWLSDPRIGAPVGPPSQVNGEWVQWFQYAQLALVGTTMDVGSSDGVVRTQVGRLFADAIGYTRNVEAFAYHEAQAGRYFAETGHTIADNVLNAYERRGTAELGLPISDAFRIGKIDYQFFEFGALSWSDATKMQRVPIGSLHAAVQGRLGSPQAQQPDDVLLASATMYDMAALLAGDHWIDIDLDARLLTAYVGQHAVMTSAVDIGHEYSPTVRGTFTVYLKNRVQTLQGETWDGTLYSAPDVPYVMYFWEDYAIHPSDSRIWYGDGTSPGCVIVPLEIAAFLWEFADYGTVVVVR